jgi:hypothetical protein
LFHWLCLLHLFLFTFCKKFFCKRFLMFSYWLILLYRIVILLTCFVAIKAFMIVSYLALMREVKCVETDSIGPHIILREPSNLWIMKLIRYCLTNSCWFFLLDFLLLLFNDSVHWDLMFSNPFWHQAFYEVLR